MPSREAVRSILVAKGSAVWSVPADTSVYDAVLLMAEKDVGALVVMEGGKLAGMFSERDYARKVILHGKSSKEALVREVMSSPVVTVSPEEKVDECMRIVTRHRVRHLPVVEGGELVGLISIGDLVNWIISAQAETIHQLSSYIAGKYPG
jgi:CBS domain-containing protein